MASTSTAPQDSQTEQLTPSQGGARGMIPPGVDPDEWHRRIDLVRSAAREFDPQSKQDIRDWLHGKTNRDLNDHEIDAFLEDVRNQRLSDLIDVMDTTLRRSIVDRARSRRTVRVVPPRGFVKRTLAGLTDDEIANVYRRLLSRGFSEDELQTHLIGRYPLVRREKLSALVGKPTEDSNGGKQKPKNRPNADSGG